MLRLNKVVLQNPDGLRMKYKGRMFGEWNDYGRLLEIISSE